MSLLTQARDLRRRRARERHGLFVAEGLRTVEELLASALAVRGVLATAAAEGAERPAALLAAARSRGVPVTLVTEAEFASAADTDAPQGILAVARVPARALDDVATPAGTRLLVLDALQDPGNVGTILRTAAAFGVGAAVALPGTVDLWNAKVVRGAMGALFRLPTVACGTADLARFLAARDVALWAADAHGTPLDAAGPRPARLALAVGNEGGGLTAETRALAHRLVGIPIAHAVESLNVAVATGILLHALRA